ncbi:MAG TPA: hypothetical protein VFT91_09820, partial [Dehalococcoidia bacterium]|nr:hypothetical protein [Dehalococcoidia bacterium]
CDTCMMHCGYEGSAIIEAMEKPAAFLELAWRSAFPALRFRRGSGKAARVSASKEEAAVK